MNSILQDLRYAFRSLRKTPAFTAVAVITLALGIGANTAIFSIVDAVLLRPLPFPEPDRLVQIWPGGGPDVGKSHSYPDVADWRTMSHSFSGIATYRPESFALTGDGEPLHVRGSVVSANLMDVLGIAPALGRSFSPADDRPGPRTVVLSDGLWRRRFGGDAGIVGRSVLVDGRSFRVSGVMPAGFQFPIEPRPPELWANAGIDAERSPEAPGEKSQAEERGWRSLRTIARVKPGVTIAHARDEMRSIALTLAAKYPDNDAHRSADLGPLHRALVRDLEPALLVLFGAVGCVLLIACANIANLLLAKAGSREKELAVRAAIGASRGRVVRQLLTESVLLALIGAGAGVLLARWGIDLVVAGGPRDVPRLSQVRLDGWVFAFTTAIALATGIAFGLAPALRAAPARLAEALKDAGRGASAGVRRNRLRSFLVVAEVTLALVLLAGAGLLLRSFDRLRHVDPGFRPDHLLSLRFNLPDRAYPRPEMTAAFVAGVVERTAALPGVRSAAAVGPLPLGGGNMGTSMEIEEKPLPKSELPVVDTRIATPGLFRTMGITLASGRDFGPEDRLDSTPVVIVNRTLARRFFPGRDPIGRRIKPGISALPGEPPFRRIVGVVGDVKHVELSEEPDVQIYLPASQVPFGAMTVVVRGAGRPLDAAPAVTAVIHAADPAVPVFDVRTIDEYMSQAVARPRFNTILLGLFAALALLLTAVGLYGVLSYSVSQRTHEIGIRRALGADDPAVYRLVVGHGMRMAGLGLLLGVAGALAATRLLSSLLFGVEPFDLPTFAAVTLGLAAVSLAASWLPARRAAGIEPTVALREE
jgi:putative ABC transport system permease protein